MTARRILVFGGAHLDRRGRIDGETAPGASNPGRWFVEAGGGGFNAARNLARLGAEVVMISPRGGDADGALVEAAATAAGVEDRPFIFLDRATPSYTAILECDGNLLVALADMELYRLFSPRRLRQRAVREAIAASDALLTDGNLPAETIAAIAEAARENGKPLAAIAISPAKVVRFRPSLDALTMLFMNEAEARALIGADLPDEPRLWPDTLRRRGLRAGVVTRGKAPAIAFDPIGAVELAPPPIETIGDVTGAGDALAAAFYAAWLAGADLSSALRQGVAAARLAVCSPLAVAEDMSLHAIHDRLPLIPEPQVLASAATTG